MSPAEEKAERTPLWRRGSFRAYWAGGAVSDLGDRVSELALPLIAVTLLAVSPTTVGLLVAAVWAPNLVSVLVGAWVDRRASSRVLMVMADLVSAGAVVSLPVAYALGHLGLAQLFVVAVVKGLAGVVRQTANATFFPRLVRRDQYVEANSLTSGTRSFSFVVGPAAGGALIQALSAPVAMVVDAVSFLGSAVALGSIRVEEGRRDHDQPRGQLGRDALAGLRLLAHHPYLRPALCCVTTLNFFSFVVQAILVLYASRSLGLSAGSIGLAFGLGALGGLLGAILAGRLARRLGAGVVIALGAVAFSAPFALLPLAGGSTTTKIIVLAAVEFVSAAAVMCFDVNLNALQTAVIPDGLRSRIVGAFATVNYGIRPLGAVVGGACAQLLGIGPTVVGAAVGGSLSVLWLLRTPVISTRSVADLEPVPPGTR